jgi:branched-subunit amino acid aminotransferase/4-amino-4-deoxychorismate lyase
MTDTIAFFNGRFMSIAEVRIGIDDIGFYQSATAVERLRTWGRELPLVDVHLRRFERSTSALGIRSLPSSAAIDSVIRELIERNEVTEDVGVTLFATPGTHGGDGQPTFCAHLTRLDFDRFRRLRTAGQPLVITAVQHPPAASWPRSIKVRCRLHYYLADRAAADRVPGGLGVLVDDDGSITETSTSNLLLVEGSNLITPPEDRVLPGVMMSVVADLAADQGWDLIRRPLSPDDLRTAEAVWLTSSEVGLWYANEVDGETKTASPRYQDFCRRLGARLNASAGRGRLPS